MPTCSTVEVELPNASTEHKYMYVPISPISARLVEKIPFSHPRQIFPLLRVSNPIASLTQILRQWSKFNSLLTSCFPKDDLSTSNLEEVKLEDLLNQTQSSSPISITPVGTPPSFVVVFSIGQEKHDLRISVLENGEIDVNVNGHLKERVCGLIENAGIGVGVEFLRKELSQ